MRGMGGERDPAEAVIWLQKAAEKGQSRAMSLLSRCCFDGSGMQKDEKRGL